MASNVGSRRLVVGAHYGLRDWLAQRLTAVLMAIYAIVFGIYAVFVLPPGYDAWAAAFAPLSMKVATLVVMIALLYHAWVGMREIFMDYLKPMWVRLVAYTVTLVWLAVCAAWSVQILWRV